MDQCELFGYFEGFSKYVYVSSSTHESMCRESLPFVNFHFKFLSDKFVFLTDQYKAALSEALDTVYLYDDEIEEWNSNSCLNFPQEKRSNFSVVEGFRNDELFVFGGCKTLSSSSEPSEKVCNEMYRLSLEDFTWRRMEGFSASPLPSGRMGHVMLKDLKTGTFQIYGGSFEEAGDLVKLDSVWQVAFRANAFVEEDSDESGSESEVDTDDEEGGEGDEPEAKLALAGMGEETKCWWSRVSAKSGVLGSIPGILPQRYDEKGLSFGKLEEEGEGGVEEEEEGGIAFCSGVRASGRVVLVGGEKGDENLWIKCYGGARTPFIRSFLGGKRQLNLEFEYVECPEEVGSSSEEEDSEEESEEEEKRKKKKKKEKEVIKHEVMNVDNTIGSVLEILGVYSREWEIKTKNLFVENTTDEEIEFFLPAVDHSKEIEKTVLLKFARQLFNDCPIFKQKRSGKKRESSSSSSSEESGGTTEESSSGGEEMEEKVNEEEVKGNWFQNFIGGIWRKSPNKGEKKKKRRKKKRKKKKRKKKKKKRGNEEPTVGESLFHLLPPILFKIRRSFKSELDGEFGDILKGFFTFCIMSPIDTSFEEFLYSDAIVDKSAEDYDDSVNLIKGFLSLDNPLKAYNVILKCNESTALPHAYHSFLQLLGRRIISICKFDSARYKDITKLRLLKRVLYVIRPFLSIGNPMSFSLKILNTFLFSNLGKKLIILMLKIGRTEKDIRAARNKVLNSRKTYNQETDEEERKKVEFAMKNLEVFLKDKSLHDCGMLRGIFRTELRTIDVDRNELLPMKKKRMEAEEEEEKLGEYESLTAGASRVVEEISSEEESSDDEEDESRKLIMEEEKVILSKIESIQEKEKKEEEELGERVIWSRKKKKEKEKVEDKKRTEENEEELAKETENTVKQLEEVLMVNDDVQDISIGENIDEEKLKKDINNNPLIKLVMSSAKRIGKVVSEISIEVEKEEEGEGMEKKEEKPKKKKKRPKRTTIEISDHFMKYFVENINGGEVDFTDFSIVQYSLFYNYFDLHNRFLEKKDFLKTLNDTKVFGTLKQIINSILPLINGMYKNSDSMFVFKIFIKLLNKLVDLLQKDHDLEEKINKLKDDTKKESLEEKRQLVWQKRKQVIYNEFEDGLFRVIHTLFKKDAQTDNLLVSLIAWLTGLQVILKNSYIKVAEFYFRFPEPEKRVQAFEEQLKMVLLQSELGKRKF